MTRSAVSVVAAPRRRRTLGELGAVMLAASTWLGAAWSAPIPRGAGVVLVAVALVLRRPLLLLAGALLLAAGLGAAARSGLEPVAPGPFEGRVTLLADPTDGPYGSKVDVRAGGRHLELAASGGAAGTLTATLAGERLWVRGRLLPPRPGSTWLVPRHVVGRIDAARAEVVDAGAMPWRAANRLRRVLGRGARVLPASAQPLYAGFVLGDDRGQPPEVVDDFRAAGLTHLLVVSGQNVAFVLALAGPLLRRVDLAVRWVVTVAVVAAFATVTRFEPSVLRASAMAVVACSATFAGRPSSSLRVLALAVTGVLLVDPLLVESVGFQLSVAASVGIVVLGAPIERRLPGPRWLAGPLAVTLAAQAGVAPVLVPRFGGLPVVAVPANLLAVPVAGLVTTWGLPAGVVAGVLGGRAAEVLHAPTRLFVAWVAGVARVAASLPLGELGPVALVLLTGAAACATRRRSRRWVRWLAVVAGLAVVLHPAVALRERAELVSANLPDGGELHIAGGATVVVLSGAPPSADLLEALRRAGVRRLDLVVVDGGRPDEVRRTLTHRWPVGRLVDARDGPVHLVVGSLDVLVALHGDISVGPFAPRR